MSYEIKWKRVKDELPPLDEELLVQLQDGRIDIGYRESSFRFSVSGEGYDYTLYEVYAWCYLPESCTVEDDYDDINYVSSRQFLGCICDALLELGKDTFLETSIRGFYTNPIEEVFAKLFPDIVIDFELWEMFEIIKNCSSGISSCFSISKDDTNTILITINRKKYNELNRNFFNKDLDVKVKEKIEKYLKEFFLDRKENV